ncbi:O-antigen ligase family protein [Staphylococcus agnetis]|uniref:O-antigen ligase family protein n=1 Tax=Staphylococcus agnetis TaxID=985762 RepID=A0ABD7TX34_9STAP|nr:O-antigen ligase family protein [Staphylococcus agnetis]UXU57625.1 O-antigen ligase family protein [Staphylococcus agnetis]
MKYVVIASIMSMNLFIVLSGLMKQIFQIPIETFYYPSQIIIALITGLYVLIHISKTKRIPLGVIILVGILFLIYASYFMSPHNDEKLATNTVIFFTLWCVSASLIGIYIKEIEKKHVVIFFKFIFLLFSFTFIAIILIPYLLGTLPSYILFGLMNYQNASYLAAYTVGIGLYLLIDDANKNNWFYYSLIILTIPSVFIPGGRGGAVLLILYLIFYVFVLTFRRNVSSFFKLFIYLLGFASFIMLVYFIITSAGESRTFQYITSNGIDIQNGSSGRAPIYQLSTFFISQRPLFGYGPFNYYHLIHNIPHNIFLEFMLSFGFIGLITILILFGIIVIRFVKNYDPKTIDLLVVFIALYPFTLLMFSTNYLVVSELWFVVFYMLTKRKRIINYGKKELHIR